MGASQSHEENEIIEEVVGVSAPEIKSLQAGGTRRRAKTLKARRPGVRKTRRQA
jgi:hypothetical protein